MDRARHLARLAALASALTAAAAGCRPAGQGGCCCRHRPGLFGYAVSTHGSSFPEFKRSRVFNPSKYPEGDWCPAGLEYEDVFFPSLDGTCLNGWYVPRENPRAVVLYLHGNSGNVTHRADILRALHEVAGVTVLIFDYRGYGRSGGRPSEKGLLADARAARAWLAWRAGVPEDQIVLLGHALGSGVAVDLAAREGAKALVLESAFTSIPDIGESYFPRLPVRLVARTELDSLGKIRRYRGPLLQAHGDQDTIVPYRLGRRLYRAAPGPKEFVTLHGHDHMDPLGEDYYHRLAGFLDRLRTGDAADRLAADTSQPDR